MSGSRETATECTPKRKPWVSEFCASTGAKKNSSSTTTSVIQKSKVNKNVAKLVSQTQRVAQVITEGNKAQNQQVHRATFSLKHFRPIKKIGIQVSAEKILLMASSTTADVKE